MKRYADLRSAAIDGVTAYADEVREHVYPAPAHEYSMPADEATRLRELLAGR